MLRGQGVVQNFNTIGCSLAVHYQSLITRDGEAPLTLKLINKCVIMTCSISAMDGPAALSIPPEPSHRTDSEPARKRRVQVS